MFANAGGKGKAENVVGLGVMRCLCFAVKHITDTGLDVCLLMGPKGEIMKRPGDYTGNVAIGVQSPQDVMKANIIPTCEELAATDSKAVSGTSSAGDPTKSSSPGESETTSSGILLYKSLLDNSAL